MIRGKLLLFAFLFAFGAVFVRLFLVQVVFADEYARDYIQGNRIEAARGSVYDSKGKPLASNKNEYRMYVEPQEIEDTDKVIEVVDEMTGIGEATIEARIDPEKVWVAIEGGMSKDIRDEVMALEVPGIGFREEPARYYPESSLAAHLLGFVGRDEDGDSIGYFGVEGYYNKDLSGLPGYVKSERDAHGKPIFVGAQQRVDPQNGRNIRLTLDAGVQAIVKERLKEAVDRFEAAEACATVADPHTMKILSMVCLPDFAPETYYEASPEAYVNTVVSRLYEPGSTFKPLIMAAAIEEDAIRPTDTFNESGPLEIGGFTIQNWNRKYVGTLSMTNILERSSNIGMVHVGTKLGQEKLYEYLKLYGLHERTGIDLQGETTGYLRPSAGWQEVDYATATFGQGIAITQLQLLTAFSSLVNGGYLMEPYVVDSFEKSGEYRSKEPVVRRRVLSNLTSEIMKKMLQSSVDHAEMKFVFPEEYKIGGKTGTAQVAVQGEYDATKTIASFIGFAPAEDPQFIALVVVREPKTSQWGSETAAPVFFEIAKELFVYYNIVPE